MKFSAQTAKIEELEDRFDTSIKKGLSSASAKKRIEKHGKNIILEQHKTSFFSIFTKQFKNIFSIILLISFLLSIVIDEYLDGIFIFIILLANVLLGAYEEYKAKKSLESLKKMAEDEVFVLRNNKLKKVKASEITVGDILYLNEGEHVPADGRVVESTLLHADESLITGESTPVEKTHKYLNKKEEKIIDQVNMVFAGTRVIKGEAWIIVTAIGKNCYIGKISKKLHKIKSPKTNLQKQIELLAKRLSLVTSFLLALIFIIGLLNGQNLHELLILSIALGISGIPEGLPMLLTTTLALGMRRLLKKHVIVKHLSAAESLSNITALCIDKTGTLTKGKMQVAKVVNLDFKDSGINTDIYSKIRLTSVLCSTSYNESNDETEVALLKFFHLSNTRIRNLRESHHIKNMIPFSPSYKFMAIQKEKTIYIKGAPKRLIQKSTCSESKKKELLRKISEYGKNGFRMLAFAKKHSNSKGDLTQSDIKNIELLGFAVFEDPIRQNAKKNISEIEKAGVNIFMLTGDQQGVAEYVGRKVGLKVNISYSGKEFSNLSLDKKKKTLKTCQIFYRMTPNQKHELLTLLQSQGHRVGMTGDGTNDALSLKQADLGIAMANATDTSKEASDIILVESSFKNIVDAIFEGRKIFLNIQKFLKITLTTNFDEILSVTISFLLKIPFFLTPIQLLFINIVTDAPPSIALAVDKVDRNVLYKKPNIFSDLLEKVFSFAFMVSLIDLMLDWAFYLIALEFLNYPIDKARTLVLINLVFFENTLAYVVRNRKGIMMFDNKILNYASIITLLLLLSVIYIPFIRTVMGTAEIPLSTFFMVGGITSGLVFMLKKR